MKALSLTQPWATLVATGRKKVETRSWSTNYRGLLYVHAAKGFPAYARRFAEEEVGIDGCPGAYPRGVIIARVRLVDIQRTEKVISKLSALEKHYGDYSPGRFAWFLEDAEKLLSPIPYRGSLGLFDVEE